MCTRSITVQNTYIDKYHQGSVVVEVVSFAHCLSANDKKITMYAPLYD